MPLPAGTSLLDLGEHRLKDLTRPERVFQVTAPDLPAEFPPLLSLDVLPNNLPRQLTSFVGREQEMADVKRLLAATSLLTLVGTGGAGKTRLALQVAADVLETYRDGAWLVELAPLTDPALVPQLVAAALGVREQAGRPTLQTLAGAPANPHAAAGAGQLRAPRRGLRSPGRRTVAGLPQPPDPGDQPRGARHRRRDDLARPVALDAGPSAARLRGGRARGGAAPVRGRAPVHRPGAGGRARLRGDQPERPGRCADLPPAGRHPARDRAGSGPGPGADAGADRGPPRRPPPAADRREQDGAAAPADAPGAGRLELRPAVRTGADAACGGCRCSPAAGRWRRPKRSAPAMASRISRSSTCSPSSWTSRSSSPKRTATRPATACWRRSASTAPRSWPPAARRSHGSALTRTGISRSPRASPATGMGLRWRPGPCD